MIATFTEYNGHNVKPSAFTARESQALIKQLSVIAVVNGELVEVVTTRFYMSPRPGASRVTCIFWVHGGTAGYVSASGTAGGYGYHKTSAALQDALKSAQIELSECISGMGEKAMIDALLAIAKAAHPEAEATSFKVFEAHN